MTLVRKILNSILFVEDNEAGRNLMREAFQSAAIASRLEMVENGVEALKFLRQEEKFKNSPTPDLILLDLNLPGKSGVEVMDEIKRDEKFQNIPIVVLTGSSAAADIQACSKFRCRYLLKPSRFHELIALVKSLPDFC